MFKNILIVCIGNICRSPVGEIVFKDYLKEHAPEVNVESAGIAAMVNYPAAEHSIEISKEHGYDLSHHKARQLNYQFMVEHDLILVMETHQKKHLEQLFPFARGKIHLLGKWRDDLEISDPYKKPKDTFEQMYQTVYD